MQSDSTVARGWTFLVTDEAGRPTRPHDGFYHRDTRHLDDYGLAAAGRTLQTVAGPVSRPGERVLHVASAIRQGARDLQVTRRQVVTDGLYERLAVENLTNAGVDETLTLRVGTAFEDVFEVRGHHPGWDRSVSIEAREHGLTFVYAADADGFDRRTSVAADRPVDIEVTERGVRAAATIGLPLSLDPDGTRTIDVAVRPAPAPESPPAAVDAAREAVAERKRAWSATTTVPGVDDHRRRAVIDRSLEDLLSLAIDTEYGPVFAAGTPWFATAFGRDSLLAAYQVLDLTTTPAEATLRYLAAYQATEVDAFRDAEPGKILHEIRHGELAARGEIPHSPYYGTVDATALFVVLLGETWRRTGDDDLVEDLAGALDAALGWLSSFGDRDDDGFLEYPTDRDGAGGLRHQAWKDSDDGIVHSDGTHPTGPLAVAEVQGYWYDARVRAADLYREVLDDPERARRLEREAADLAAAFDRAFWLPDEQFYAVALDGTDRPVETVTTNPAHCLWSGMLTADRADAVIDRLLAEDVFTGWGLRTTSADHPVYNPQSYHLGSVWPHDTSIAVLGMARYGRRRAAERVTDGLFAAALARDNDRLPELFAGFDREATELPVQYGAACEPQAWAAAAPLACLRAVRGDVEPAPRIDQTGHDN